MSLTFPTPPLALRRVIGRGLVSIGLVSALAIAAVAGSLFRVQQNEVAYLTRFGKVIAPEAGPLLPGLHFKLPLIDQADQIAVSTDTVRFGAMRAFTRDTQEVSLQVSVTYRVPPAAA